MNIYKKALEKWGIKSQLEMAQEESTELALAIRKFIRDGNDETFNALADGMADVEIMLSQLRHMYPEIEEKIKERKKFKIAKLLKLLEN